MDDRLTSPEDEQDVEAHSLTRNDNETVITDDEDTDVADDNENADVEAHSLTRNDNETVITD